MQVNLDRLRDESADQICAAESFCPDKVHPKPATEGTTEAAADAYGAFPPSVAPQPDAVEVTSSRPTTQPPSKAPVLPTSPEPTTQPFAASALDAYN